MKSSSSTCAAFSGSTTRVSSSSSASPTPNDPAIEVVQKLQREFPGQDAQLIVGCPAFGLNPKVESLAAMDRHRKHDVILISDSNVRVRPSYLRETACYLAEPGLGW